MPEQIPSEAEERALIAEQLDENRDRIVADWMKAVMADVQIPSADRLTITALRDHFPEMLQELVEAIRNPREANDAGTREAGTAHGKARWRSGYRLDEVIRELGRVREMILKEICTTRRGRITVESRDAVGQTVRQFFDTIAATSAQQFVHGQEAEVVLRSNQLEHAYEQLQAATQQTRAVAESRLSLLRATTHELRNAMQPVTLAAEALLEETNAINREEIARQLSAISIRLQALLDRLAKLSSVLSGDARVRLVSVSFQTLLRNLEEDYRSMAEKRRLEYQSDQDAPFTEAVSDPDVLREIGGILLSNAIKNTNAGFVRIEILGAESMRWILRVTDTGKGIDPIDAHHIFTEFHSRSESTSQELRLGLILARHLARLLGGEITFQSTIGQGSSFEVNLPRFL